MFVPTLVIITVAFGTTAPVGSVIVPVMTPCTVCDQTAPALARTSKAATKKNKSTQSHTLSPVQWPIGQSFEHDFKIWLVQRNSIHPDHPVGTKCRANSTI